MRNSFLKRLGALAFALGLALAGCKGDTGPAGPQGAQGDPGQNGNDGAAGVSVGVITGTIVTGGVGVPGATVTTSPLNIASAATGANGQYTISNVPIGIYTLNVTGTGFAATSIPNVVVVATTTTTVAAKEVTYSPITLAVAATPVPAGFGKTIPLTATVTGATGAVTYAWSQVTGPTTGVFSDAAAAAPTFTTGTLEAVIAGGKLRNLTVLPARDALIAFTAQQVTNSNYGLKLEVTDAAGYKQSKTFTVTPAVVNAGQNMGATANVPLNIMVMASTPAVAAGDWHLTKPATSVAALEGATTKNPWFIPDVEGEYVLRNGGASGAVVSAVTASNWHGAPAATCAGACHNNFPAEKANVELKFKLWRNSAHGNHFFKFFEYDLAGNLVPKGGGATVTVPTASATGQTWDISAPMTTFEYGITGGEYNHYSESCMRCHTVGMNLAVSNGGIDDQTGYAAAMAAVLAGLPATVPAAPIASNFTGLPQGVQDRAGMQCESCHGPLTSHLAGGAVPPKAFFDSGTCGVCHDSGTNHDRYNLWSQSGHANLTLAMDESVSVDAALNESLNGNCGRCHSAQGFVAWAKAGFTLANVAADPGVKLSNVEPLTCVACHDAHATTLRVNEAQPVTITSGFTVSGAGAGQLCVICHSSRRGLHNDSNAPTSYSLPHAAAQSDLFFGQNVYFFGALDDGSTMSTHAYVLEGTCAGCHMEKDLAFVGLNGGVGVANYMPRTTNHSFRVNTDLCAKCHEGASLAGLKERTEGGILELKAAIANAARLTIPAAAGFRMIVPTVVPSISASACNLIARFDAVPRPTTVALGMPTGHGAGFTFTWAADVAYTIFAADNAAVDCDSVTDGTQAISADIGPTTIAANTLVGAPLNTSLTSLDGATVLIPANGDLFKAWWNLALIEDEGSLGAHNPGFTQQVLAVSKAKVVAATPAP